MATYFDLISENDESTVVAQFENSYMVGERPYMSEKNLEDQFVAQLQDQQYEYVRLTTEAELIDNLRKQIELLNGIAFNDGKIYLTGKNWPKLYEVKLVR